ncbi:MAG TPA: class I SAM-dependent methyltransferase [Vicinamibacterales bacterium]|nr:class I SAM-dependent methyltransferase [Vicinamibacterales bacterium]
MSGFFKWGRKAVTEPAAMPPAVTVSDPVVPSKVLPAFLSSVSRQSSPVLLDLGPVVGSNVQLFGDRLACRLHVQDLFEQIRRATDPAAADLVLASLRARLPTEPDSVDGILCWDVFDYLDPLVSHSLAGDLVRLLRPGGVLHGYFATASTPLSTFTRFVVEADDAIRLQAYPGPTTRRRVLSLRDVERMFGGLRLAESVLLRTGSREMLFRRAAASP